MEQKPSENRLLVRVHFFLALILLLHSVLFLIYWFAVPDFRIEVDQLLTTRIGLKLPYILISIGVTVLISLWSLIRSVKFAFGIRKGLWKPDWKNWSFFAVWILFLVAFYGTFWLILRGNPSQKGVIIHLLSDIRLFSDALILLLSSILLWRLLKLVKAKMTDDKKKWPLRVAVIFALVLLIGLWLVPTIFPPNWAYRGSLPAKPAVIADGGAARLAPENTLAAVELAGAQNAFGFETYVRISSDGEPFLLRDETFARTTNIAEVYPSRANDLASSFDIDEIDNLNAGLWFIQTDPYDSIENGEISQKQLSINQGQAIPTLSEALAFVTDQDMIVLLHLIRPPENHPYYDEFFDIVLSICQESDLNDEIWLELEQDQIRISQLESPQITRVLAVSSQEKPEVADILARGYEIIHVDTGIPSKSIRELRDEGLGVNVYTINQPWLFSQFWLSGVTSVSTTNVELFGGLENPLINLPYTSYLLIWGLFGIVFAIWLASSFPLPERKIKPEAEIPAPSEPELEGLGEVPALSPEVPPVIFAEAETLTQDETPSETVAEPIESDESNQPVQPIETDAPFEPVESIEKDESTQSEESVEPSLVSEELAQIIPIEETPQASEDYGGQQLVETGPIEVKPIADDDEEGEQLDAFTETGEMLESEFHPGDEGEDGFTSDLGEDVDPEDNEQA
jgi:glycerophosphoryl diester phosphodiesterase